MQGPIALVGGDEFRPGCREMDEALLGATGAKSPRVLVLPTAAAFENPGRAAAKGVEYYASLGAKASALMVLGSDEANDEAFLKPVRSADVIVLTGGNPRHLLDRLQGSALLSELRRANARGATLVGSSAGAMVLGSWMRYRGWSEALGVVDGVVVLPHHEGSDPASVAAGLEAEAPPGLTTLGIDAMSCCLSGPDGWQVLGAGCVTVYRAGRWRRYCQGESWRLDDVAVD